MNREFLVRPGKFFNKKTQKNKTYLAVLLEAPYMAIINDDWFYDLVACKWIKCTFVDEYIKNKNNKIDNQSFTNEG